MIYTNVSTSVSSLNSTDSSRLIALLRQVGKKFYLGKTSVLHLSSEEFMSDTWSDRIRVEYHGLVIVLETWLWNGKNMCSLEGYYNGEKLNLLFDEELEKYSRIILWYLSQYDFRDIYHLPLFKDEIAKTLELKDEVRKFDKNHKKVDEELFTFLTK